MKRRISSRISFSRTLSRVTYPSLLRAISILVPLLPFGNAAQAQLPTEPFQLYLNVGEFELRYEIVGKLDELNDLKDPVRESISSAEKIAILEGMEGKFATLVELELDGVPVELRFERIEFVRLTVDRGVVSDDREMIPASDATVAATYEVICERAPEMVVLYPKQTPARIEAFPVHLLAGGETETKNCSRETEKLIWNVPQGVKKSGIIQLPDPPRRTVFYLSPYSLSLLLIAALIGMVSRKKLASFRSVFAVASVACLSGAFLFSGYGLITKPVPFCRPPAPDSSDACEITEGILKNIYRAFDFRTEDRIYDTLSESVDKNLLENIYLEILGDLEVENQGGIRVQVEEVHVRRCRMEPGDGAAYIAEAEWVVIGDVTHWGHTHRQQSLFEARLVLDGVSGVWKISGIDILNEERI